MEIDAFGVFNSGPFSQIHLFDLSGWFNSASWTSLVAQLVEHLQGMLLKSHFFHCLEMCVVLCCFAFSNIWVLSCINMHVYRLELKHLASLPESPLLHGQSFHTLESIIRGCVYAREKSLGTNLYVDSCTCTCVLCSLPQLLRKPIISVAMQRLAYLVSSLTACTL